MKKKEEEFPILIPKNSPRVKIYKGENRGRPIYSLTYIDANGRQREFFRDLKEALAAGKSRAEKLIIGDHEALRLTGQDRQLYVAAAEAIRPTGIPLDVAARDFAAAFAELGGNMILEAARHYKKTVLRGLPEMTVAKAVDEYISAKESEGQSDLYMKDLRGLLGKRFKEAFKCQLREVTADHIREYLQKLGVGPVTRNNHLRLIRGLFTHAKAHGWLNKNESTSADAIGTAKPKPKDSVEIYTPSEMASLLAAADDDFRVWLVLIGFCGVRREEVSRLQWNAIDFEAGRITIPKSVAKTKKKRPIDLQPNAAAWLADYKDEEGPIFAIDPRKRMARTLARANAERAKQELSPIKWKTNALRHSFCSYRMEQCKNAGQVADEAGNSAGIIMRHYREVVSAKDAAAWWAIMPPAAVEDGKITNIKAA